MSTAITTKGQVTIPVEIRRQLGLRAGDHLEFHEEHGRYYLRPIRHEIAAAFGRVTLQHPVSDAAVKEAIRQGAIRG